MTVLGIVTYPDKRLRTVSEPVVKVDDDVRDLIYNMAETMYAASGVGLAANQVGVLQRIAVIDVDYPKGSPNLLVLVNPEIIVNEGQTTTEEGCLSFPNVCIDRMSFLKKTLIHNQMTKKKVDSCHRE